MVTEIVLRDGSTVRLIEGSQRNSFRAPNRKRYADLPDASGPVGLVTDTAEFTYVGIRRGPESKGAEFSVGGVEMKLEPGGALGVTLRDGQELTVTESGDYKPVVVKRFRS